MGIVIALLILSFLIFFHELGHFLAARFFGVHVEVFSIGFGKRLVTKKWGDTEYSLSAVPLGGYVRMKGQDDLEPAKVSTDTDSYNAKKPWQRIIILLAGPFANFFIAFVLFILIGLIGMQALGTKVGTTVADGPAARAGIVKGDIITAVNGQKVYDFKSMSRLIAASKDPIKLTVKRGEKVLNFSFNTIIQETEDIFKDRHKKRMIGISLDGSYTVYKRYGLWGSFVYGWEQTLEMSTMIFKSVQKLIVGAIPMKELGGVISIVDLTSKASTQGIALLFFITALISVNLGVLNLLPIPALDGGHIMFNLYEIVARRPASEKMMIRLTIIGWGILLALMGIGVYNDITRLMQ